MMEEQPVYAILVILIGIIGILWARNAPKTKDDPFLGKITQYVFGVLCIVIGLILLIRYVF
jgi:uncharacterized membrane protein HdeD (DUF308 family)